MEQAVVMYDSPEAATFKTGLSGWVSGEGIFYGDNESIARYAGCTHRSCATCANVVEKSRIRCRSCQAQRDLEKWQALPVEKYDGQTPLCVFDGDRYFFDEDNVMDYVRDEHEAGREIRLCKCKPGNLSYIGEDNWADDLPEDGELPAEVVAALDVLNAAIKESGPVCWWEDSIAIDADDLIAGLDTGASRRQAERVGEQHEAS